jgi:thymidylate synthase
MIINHHYTIPFKDVKTFKFMQYGVNEVCYKYRIFPHIGRITRNLKKKSNSRQEVIVANNMLNNACLISLQYQIVDNELICIANFRSQCEVNGRPSDTVMLQYITNIIRKRLKLNSFVIHVNVGNYHINEELTVSNLNNPYVQRNLKYLNKLST